MSELTRKVGDVISLFEGPNLSLFFKENLGEYSLVQFKGRLLNIHKKLNLIKELLIEDELSMVDTRELIISLSKLENEVVRVINHSNNDEFLVQRTDIIAKLESAYDRFISIWPKISSLIIEQKIEDLEADNFITEAKTRSERTRRLEEEIEGRVKTVTEIKDTLENKISAIESRYEDVVQKFEIASGTVMFEKLAEGNLKKANIWLVPAIVSLLTLVGVLIYFWVHICQNHLCVLENGLCQFCQLKTIGVEYTQSLFVFELIKVWAFKVFCISLLLYVVLFCLKQYQIQMHNFTINSHKAGALNSATSLLEVIGKTIRQENESAKEQIISKAADSIFSHQKTGYNSKDKEPDMNIIMSLLKNIKP